MYTETEREGERESGWKRDSGRAGEGGPRCGSRGGEDAGRGLKLWEPGETEVSHVLTT